MGVVQLLSWEPDCGNRRVLFALVQMGEAAWEQETQRGGGVYKITAHSRSPINPRLLDAAQQEDWVTTPIKVVTVGA